MPALSKKYKINYKRRYTIPKNKKQRGRKSIKVYHNSAKQQTRKRKNYMGGDIEVHPIYNIFPSGQSYQPNITCLEKECDKKDASEKTTTCLNTLVVMNLFRQNLDASEQETMVRMNSNFTDEERKQVQDLTEKYLTNYIDSLFSKSFFSKNNAELTPENRQKLKELLQVIKPEYVNYLTRNSTLSDEIKQTIRATTPPELNVVATPAATNNAPIDNANASNIDVVDVEVGAQTPPDAAGEAEAQIPPDAAVEAQIPPGAAVEAQRQQVAEAEPEAQRQQVAEAEPEAQRQQVEAEAEAQRRQVAEAEAEAQRQQATEAEMQRQQAADAEATNVAKKAAKKAEEDRFNAAKKAEMEQRFAQRRADSAAADVKRKEDLAEKKAARAAANLIKEENRAAAKTLKNTTALKKSSGSATRKKR
jgi:hypothetical protein